MANPRHYRRHFRRQPIIPLCHRLKDSTESKPDPTLFLPWELSEHVIHAGLSVLHLLLRHDDLALMESWWSVLDGPQHQDLFPAHTAIEMGAVKCFTHIVENYPSWLDRQNFNHFPAFAYAVRGGPMFYDVLLDRTDLGAVYGHERVTALHVLFRGCHDNMLSSVPLHAPVTAALLIDKGCDVNAGDKYHRRAINDLVEGIMELSPGMRRVESRFLARCVRERVPSLSECRIAIRSSLQVLLEKGAMPDCYRTAIPSMEVVANTLWMYNRDIEHLDAEELAATVESLCDISDMLLSHGACRHPCADFFTKQWDPAALETIRKYRWNPHDWEGAMDTIRAYEGNPHEQESILTKYFVELQPIVQLFLNTLPHREYYDALENLSKAAGDKTQAICNTEHGEITERSTRNAVALSRFIRQREQHVRSLKHITRLYIAAFFGGYVGVANLTDAAQLPLPEFLCGYIFRYKD